MMLAQLIILVPVSILLSLLFAMAASFDPMKMAIRSLGVAAAVARANINGCTVGKVDIAPLEMLYGSGHSRIMTRSLSPSCFKTRDSASKRRSCATMRLTNFESRVRETMKEQVDPTMVADATMGQLSCSQLKMQRYTLSLQMDDSRTSSPPWKAIDETCQGQTCRIAYDGRKRRGKTHQP